MLKCYKCNAHSEFDETLFATDSQQILLLSKSNKMSIAETREGGRLEISKRLIGFPKLQSIVTVQIYRS